MSPHLLAENMAFSLLFINIARYHELFEREFTSISLDRRKERNNNGGRNWIWMIICQDRE